MPEIGAPGKRSLAGPGTKKAAPIPRSGFELIP